MTSNSPRKENPLENSKSPEEGIRTPSDLTNSHLHGHSTSNVSTPKISKRSDNAVGANSRVSSDILITQKAPDLYQQQDLRARAIPTEVADSIKLTNSKENVTHCKDASHAEMKANNIFDDEEDDKDYQEDMTKSWIQRKKDKIAYFKKRVKETLNREYIINHARPPIMAILIIATYFAIFSFLLKDEGKTREIFFSLMLVVVSGIFGGIIASNYFNTAPLLGMLVGGIVIRNIPHLMGEELPPHLTNKLRAIALTIILSRAGIGLQMQTIISNAKGTLLIGVLPVILEAIINTATVKFIMGYDLPWALMLGFGLSPISPGIVVPLLLNLKEEKRGIRSGIVPMMLAATGLDVVTGITGFSIASGIVFSDEKGIMFYLHGPLELFGGIAAGCICGGFIYLLEKLKTPINFRTFIVTGFALVCMLGGKTYKYSGAASLGTMITWCFAANLWDVKTVELTGKKLKMIWEFAQPFLFPLIGASIKFSEIDYDVYTKGLAIILIGFCVRFVVVYVLSWAQGIYSKEECLFMAGGWTAKATVQAALSYAAKEAVEKFETTGHELTDEENLAIHRADQVFQVMVFAILVCAPICATWIQYFGRRNLTQDEMIPDEDPNEAGRDELISEPTGLGIMGLAKKQITAIMEDKH